MKQRPCLSKQAFSSVGSGQEIRHHRHMVIESWMIDVTENNRVRGWKEVPGLDKEGRLL